MSRERFDPRPPSRKLYKNPDQAKICGVCAGIAEYFGMEVWVVRIITISMCLFSFGIFNGPVFLAYLILCFVLDRKPGSQSRRGCFGHRERYAESSVSSHSNREDRPYRPTVREVWKKGSSPRDTLQGLEKRFSRMEGKLQNMESFVTSKQFELEKEFNAM